MIHRHKAVIGLGFGDEGKGLVTDYLCSKSQNPLVVRYSGGQQAGHTVYFNGEPHVFSNFGSGTFRGAPTYWSKNCTVDPIAMARELNVLKSKGVWPTIYIDLDAPVTTPYDALSNINDPKYIKNGTCGVGVGKTFEREEKGCYFRFKDLLEPEHILKLRLASVGKYYDWKDIDIYEFLGATEFLTKHKKIHAVQDLDIWDSFEVIHEGSQGLLLDREIGFYPHITRSYTGSVGIKNIGGDLSQTDKFYITRAYQTRHGSGPMTNRDKDHNIIADERETNQEHKYQGDFRRTILDIDLLKYALKRDGGYRQCTLVVTCLDHLARDYRYSKNGYAIKCVDKKDFLNQIKSELALGKILVSETPFAENIYEY